MTDRDFAVRWAHTRTHDLNAHAALYAPDTKFVIELAKVDDHMEDSINDRAELRSKLAYWSNQDPSSGDGVHSMTVTEVFTGNGHIFIHWDYAIEYLDAFHGVPADGRRVETLASTFLEFDDQGKIAQEATIINDNRIYQQLGLPIVTPHYWDEDFDPSTLPA
ncbi:nuclear transport factor 2 family protein [Mycobacterium intracellulare]|uniref:nuclear transport factor 2 family protein n=1 Tax=Mycobacterium intracellulare TaxID=1767 RepID=UPI001EED490A|nr:nuclear transport factor 2 family protein [Mycobacterium intracellulare]MEE3753117.1 nuclear transport factor 2 family protein [Mycobacterium intracellulare]